MLIFYPAGEAPGLKMMSQLLTHVKDKLVRVEKRGLLNGTEHISTSCSVAEWWLTFLICFHCRPLNKAEEARACGRLFYDHIFLMFSFV
ncbi:unnamed protein product [Brassica oleracea var. botrytis]